MLRALSPNKTAPEVRATYCPDWDNSWHLPVRRASVREVPSSSSSRDHKSCTLLSLSHVFLMHSYGWTGSAAGCNSSKSCSRERQRAVVVAGTAHEPLPLTPPIEVACGYATHTGNEVHNCTRLFAALTDVTHYLLFFLSLSIIHR
jgi:hypothetical protein